MPRKQILIVSGSGDAPNFGSVAGFLQKAGYEVTVFEPDKIASGSKQFSVHLTPDGELQFTYEGKPFDLRAFSAAWSRRPSFVSPPKDQLRWSIIKDEYAALARSLQQLIPPAIWLNPPETMRAASNKLPQLQAAAQLGFTIPETWITNDWAVLEVQNHEKLIAKFNHNILLPEKDTHKVMGTTIFEITALPKHVLPYPGIWQPFKSKKREWRITIVGKQAFCVAIYTTEDAKDDWRRHQFSDRTTFKVEPFPDTYIRLCRKFLAHYGLRYGAFDFIETSEGEMIFLELNPNGQFMWLEQDLELPISAAIADELAAIAEAAH